MLCLEPFSPSLCPRGAFVARPFYPERRCIMNQQDLENRRFFRDDEQTPQGLAVRKAHSPLEEQQKHYQGTFAWILCRRPSSSPCPPVTGCGCALLLEVFALYFAGL